MINHEIWVIAVSEDDTVNKLTTPLLLGNMIYTGSRELIGYYIMLRDRPGALLEILSVFSRHSISVWSMAAGLWTGEGAVRSKFIVADFTEATVDPEVVKEEIVRLDVVEEVVIVKPQQPGILVDIFHFPIVDDRGSRYILFSEKNMESFIVKARERFGPSIQAFLYHQGVITGEMLKEKYRVFGVRSLRDALETLLLHSTALGRYTAHIVYYSYGNPLVEDAIVLRLYNNWECYIARRCGVKGPASHFERGVIAGLIQAYTDRRVEIVEAQCMADGAEFCELIVSFMD